MASRIEERKDSVFVSTNSGENFVTRFLIGADGVNSIVALQSRLRQTWAPTQVAIDGTEESIALNTDRDTMYVHYGIDYTYGYGYVFPKCAHVNLGVGYLLTYFRDHIDKKPWDDHEKFIQRLREVGIINGISSRENFHAFLLPVPGPLRHLSTNRILLVGDAGGFVNGFTAEGIYYSMVIGEHAGITVREALSEKVPNASDLRRYDERCLKEVGDELRKSVSIQKLLLADPTRIDKIVALARRNPAVRQLVTQFAVGALSYIRFRRQLMLKALPFYVSHKVSKVWQKLS
jgi:flavin-dependent dehydrogenase